MQLVGATALVGVLVVHVFERFDILPVFGWGQPHSLGHDLDVVLALGGLVLFPIGYLLDAVGSAGRRS